MHWKSLWRIIFHGKHPTLEQGKSVKRPLPEDKGAAENIWDELTAAPIFYPPAPLRGESRENGE